MSRFVAVGTNMETSHTFGWSARCAIRASCRHVVVPTNVPFALKAQLVLLEFLWAVFLCSAQLSSLPWLLRPFSRFHISCFRFFHRWLWRHLNRLRCCGWERKDKHCNARIRRELLKWLIQGWNIIGGLQRPCVLLGEDRPQFFVRTDHLLHFDTREAIWDVTGH